MNQGAASHQHSATLDTRGELINHSMQELHNVALYVLGEKLQMKVRIYLSCALFCSTVTFEIKIFIKIFVVCWMVPPSWGILVMTLRDRFLDTENDISNLGFIYMLCL